MYLTPLKCSNKKRELKNEKECWHHLREYLSCQEVNSTVNVSE